MSNDVINLLVWSFLLPAFILGIVAGFILPSKPASKVYTPAWGFAVALLNSIIHALLFYTFYSLPHWPKDPKSIPKEFIFLLLIEYIPASLGVATAIALSVRYARFRNHKRTTVFGALALFFLITFLTLPMGSGSLEKARKASDSSNLKQIGLTIRMYSQENSEHFPLDLGLLMDQEYVRSGKDFVSPNSSTPQPQTGDDIRSGKCDYLYFGQGFTEESSGLDIIPIATTKPNATSDKLVYVLFGDGHVQKYKTPPDNVKALWDKWQSDQTQSSRDRK